MASRVIFKGLVVPQRSFHQSLTVLNGPTTRRRFFGEPPKKSTTQPRQLTENLSLVEVSRIRTVPTLNTFYGGNPVHEDNINKVKAILKKYQSLPTQTMTDELLKNTKFIGFEEYTKRTNSGTRVKEIHYRDLITLLNRLRTIDSQLMPSEVSSVLAEYTSQSSNKVSQMKKEKTLDCFGRAKAQAKRKSSVAKVHVVKGDGQVLINGKPLVEYFGNVYARKNVLYPFQVIEQEGKYNVSAYVKSGGYTGQSEAIMYAIAKALIVFNPLLKPRLSKAGLMTSDSRIVERKKPGKVKARKSPTWVKR
ncbi:MRPS9 37S ribosomal protein S9 [Candida maltosa Xu316]|uniref:Small ribosomal subunit protein uS9m n=1 Tax=Candida maltosa (strain Xu316) TaxID=1245528 RepID=M3K2J1_CANMX|nr:40S ribosomal protein S9, mitochondrial [Candida maltosa Xu316]